MEYDDGTYRHNAEEFFNVGLSAVRLIGEDELRNIDCVGYVIYEASILEKKNK